MDLLLSVTGAIRPHLRAMDNHASDIRSVSAVDIQSEERNEGRVRIVDIACRSGILVTNHTARLRRLIKKRTRVFGTGHREMCESSRTGNDGLKIP
jgi:hypothetical protein